MIPKTFTTPAMENWINIQMKMGLIPKNKGQKKEVKNII